MAPGSAGRVSHSHLLGGIAATTLASNMRADGDQDEGNAVAASPISRDLLVCQFSTASRGHGRSGRLSWRPMGMRSSTGLDPLHGRSRSLVSLLPDLVRRLRLT